MSSHHGPEARGHRLRPVMIPTLLLLAVSTLVAPSVAGANGFTSKSAGQIFKTAVSDSGAAGSFTVHGDIRQPKMDLTLDLSLSDSGLADGSLSINGGKAQIREISGVGYFEGDTAFWTKNANAATAQLFAGKWIYAPVTNSFFSSFRSFLSPRPFIQSFFGSDQGPYTKGTTRVIDGKRTIGVMSDGPGTMYVATSGAHVIVNVQGSQGTSSVSLTFGSYGVAVHPVKPADAVSLQSLESSS